MKRGFWAKAGLALLGCALALALTELGLRLVFPPNDLFLVWPANLHTTFDPLPGVMPGIEGLVHFDTNSVGLRGDEMGGDYQILTIGGSTTECIYLDTDESWPGALQVNLQAAGAGVWVGNGGRSGRNTRNHILQMQYLLPQFPEVDAVVMLTGVNDLVIVRLQSGSNFDPGFMDLPDSEERRLRLAFEDVPQDFAFADPALEARVRGSWWERTGIWRLVQTLRRNRNTAQATEAGEAIEQDRVGQYYVTQRQRRANGTFTNTLPDLASAIAEYKRNLNTLADIAEANGVRLILLTQPSIWQADTPPEIDRWLWFARGEDDIYYTNAAMATAMQMYNDALLAVCADRGLECIDLANLLPKDLTVFYDDVHFNESGAAMVADILTEYFLGHPPIAP